jgi:hypothetical protein
MAITTTFMTYRRLNSMFFYYDLKKKKKRLMINLDQMTPRFYGLKLAGSIFAGKENFIYFSNNNLFIIAYLLGKASYIPECRRLILQRLPNSNLAHTLESKPYDLISDMYEYILPLFFD